jgi:hypothetical protein
MSLIHRATAPRPSTHEPDRPDRAARREPDRGRSRQGLGLALILALTLAAGCATSGQVRSVSQAVRAELPGIELDREVHLRLGPISFSLVRGLASLAGDELDEDDARILAAIRRVEIDVYEVRSSAPPEPSALPRLARLEERLRDQGWEPVMTVRDDGELGMVMTREDRRGRIRGMFLISYDSDELAVIRLEGHLDDLLAAAIADDPDAFIGTVAGDPGSST